MHERKQYFISFRNKFTCCALETRSKYFYSSLTQILYNKTVISLTKDCPNKFMETSCGVKYNYFAQEPCKTDWYTSLVARSLIFLLQVFLTLQLTINQTFHERKSTLLLPSPIPHGMTSEQVLGQRNTGPIHFLEGRHIQLENSTSPSVQAQ